MSPSTFISRRAIENSKQTVGFHRKETLNTNVRQLPKTVDLIDNVDVSFHHSAEVVLLAFHRWQQLRNLGEWRSR